MHNGTLTRSAFTYIRSGLMSQIVMSPSDSRAMTEKALETALALLVDWSAAVETAPKTSGILHVVLNGKFLAMAGPVGIILYVVISVSDVRQDDAAFGKETPRIRQICN